METFANDTKYIMSKIGMPLEELTYQVVNIYFNCLTSCLGPKKQGFWPKINCTQRKLPNFVNPCDFPSEFSMSKIIQIIQIFFSMNNTCLGAHFLLELFFDNFNF